MENKKGYIFVEFNSQSAYITEDCLSMDNFEVFFKESEHRVCFEKHDKGFRFTKYTNRLGHDISGNITDVIPIFYKQFDPNGGWDEVKHHNLKELLSKFEGGEERYVKDNGFKVTIDTLMSGVDEYQVIDYLLDV